MITLAMAMPGSLFVYMGEELGLPEVLDMPDDRRQDPVFITTNGERIGRDGCRVPLPWTNEPTTNFGFSALRDGDDPSGNVAEPWLPQPRWWGDLAVDMADQQDDSTLQLYREVIAARRELAIPHGLEATVLELGAGLVAVRRGDLVVVTNVTDEPIALDAAGDDLADATPVFASEPGELHTPGVIPPDSTIWFARP